MSGGTARVLYLVVCAAPPARQIGELIDELLAEDWDVHTIATETAARWLSDEHITARTGHPLLHRQRHPDEPSTLPRADAVAVVPATFNTISKWATGVNDSLALGILNESLSTDLPIIAAPYAKPALVSHPAYHAHLAVLAGSGVRLTATEEIRPLRDGQPFQWHIVLAALRSALTGDQTGPHATPASGHGASVKQGDTTS